jgi:hypothetical protein
MSGDLVMVSPSAGSTAAFVVLVVALSGLLLAGVVSAGRKLGEPDGVRRRHALVATLGILGWLALTAVASASGVLQRAGLPPPLMLFFVASMGVAIAAAFSRFGTRLVRGLPIAALVAVQAFRLPLELILHAWKDQGVLPIQMTYEGHNFDIVSGTLALALGIWLWRGRAPRAAIWGFNLIGSALLLWVATIAVLSSPLPIRQYMNEPAVLLAFYFPYGWIIPICVGGALFGHILIFRWLLSPSTAARPARTALSAAAS